MELITLTSLSKQSDFREELIDGIFPEADVDETERPFIFMKPTIFISSRVHPGETPASIALNGIVKFLLSDSEQA